MTTLGIVFLAVTVPIYLAYYVRLIVWSYYEQKRPCYLCRFHGALSRHAPCDTCGVKHEDWEAKEEME